MLFAFVVNARCHQQVWPADDNRSQLSASSYGRGSDGTGRSSECQPEMIPNQALAGNATIRVRCHFIAIFGCLEVRANKTAEDCGAYNANTFDAHTHTCTHNTTISHHHLLSKPPLLPASSKNRRSGDHRADCS